MRSGLALDHIAIAAKTLDEGIAFVEAVLGVSLARGGKHAAMGTHNALLSLGPGTYLEVIAVDPDAAPPGRRRWFNLDAYDGPPRLLNWVVRTDDLDAALADAPAGAGRPLDLERDGLTWRMAVPDFGRLPYDDAAPALMQWGDMKHHPAGALPDEDLRLERLDVFHPDVGALLGDYPALKGMDRVSFREGPEKRLIATIRTPAGNRILA